MSKHWKVVVVNEGAQKGDVVPVEADTEERARAKALEVTPGNLDRVQRCSTRSRRSRAGTRVAIGRTGERSQPTRRSNT